eukprot:scaffold246496_cov21-Prasinocladus_malaysianus.AAC.1
MVTSHSCCDEDTASVQVEEEASGDAYAHEPERDPALKVLTDKPFNGETPLQVLEDYDVTPVRWHFKRHHLPVPLATVSNPSKT